LDTKVKGQGHHPALLNAVLTRQAAAAVSVGTYWPWETTATLRSARRREADRRPQREERGGAYYGGRPPTACFHIDLAPYQRQQTKWRCSQMITSWIMRPVFCGTAVIVNNIRRLRCRSAYKLRFECRRFVAARISELISS